VGRREEGRRSRCLSEKDILFETDENYDMSNLHQLRYADQSIRKDREGRFV
jgi:hypothetical protein